MLLAIYEYRLYLLHLHHRYARGDGRCCSGQ